jgi:hypothetical protein
MAYVLFIELAVVQWQASISFKRGITQNTIFEQGRRIKK